MRKIIDNGVIITKKINPSIIGFVILLSNKPILLHIILNGVKQLGKIKEIRNISIEIDKNNNASE